MGILDKLFSGESKKTTDQKAVKITPFKGTSIIQRFGGFNYNGAIVSKDYLAEYKNWVFSCVQARAEAAGDIELKLYKNGEEIFDHPILDLLNRVNPYMTRNDLFEYTQAFKDLNGNAFWYLAKDEAKKKIQEIYLLKPDQMRIVVNKENPLEIEKYLFRAPDGSVIKFDPDEIIHHKNFDPRAGHPYPHLGMGIVEAAAFAIDTDNETRKWNLNFFRNGARPDGILYQDGETAANDAVQQDRLRNEWEEEHQGSDNAHKITILSGGMKYQELTRSQTDMDFYNGRTFSRDEILALFRVPKTIIGITDDVNRANADAAMYVFSLRTVKPLMQKLVNTLNEYLVPLFGDNSIRFGFKSPVIEDRASIIAEYTAGFNLWLSRNDIRRREGLAPTENGEQMTRSFGEEVADETPVPEKTNGGAKGGMPQRKEKSHSQEIVEKFLSQLPKSAWQKNKTERKGIINEELKQEIIDGWNKRADTNVKVLKNKIRSYFAAQEKEVQQNLKEELKGLKSPEFRYKAIDDMLFDMDKSVKLGISLITPFIQQYIRESGKAGNAAARGDGFDENNARVERFKETRAQYFAKTINETTQQELFDSIQEGIENQESLDDISKRVAKVYEKAQDFRTDMIARTEVAASSNFGTVEGYKQAGVEEHQWAVVDPDDEDCLENDGEIRAIGDPFPSGDTEAPIHPNCMCTTIPVFKD